LVLEKSLKKKEINSSNIHCVSKNDTDVAHYIFDAHQPIW